jgi:hypothetical protein
MLWLIGIVQEVTDIPVRIDNSSPGTLAAAMDYVKQVPMVNSVNAGPGAAGGISAPDQREAYHGGGGLRHPGGEASH